MRSSIFPCHHGRRKAGAFRPFTLVEVVVSLGILAISLGTLFQMTTSARSRLTKAQEDWNKLHMATQAAEYILAHRCDVESIPDDFFPYKDYDVRITYEEVDDAQIPEDYYNIDSQLPLELCVIELLNLRPTGKEVEETLLIERIVYDDAGLVPEDYL